MFDAKWFFDLEKQICELGVDSDAQSFDDIKQNLSCPKKLSPDDFANNCAYVILAGGFSQKTAKKIHQQIMRDIFTNGAEYDSLIKIFNNKNKINAICKIWDNRKNFCDAFYALKDDQEKINYLTKLPHIGKITANHLGRNLGIDIVKYDIWIQRLGILYGGNNNLQPDNKKLNDYIKIACDAMFNKLVAETNLPRGYIDVVLWKACQIGLITF